MLDRLRSGDESGVEHLLVGDFAGDFVGFLDDAVDRRAGGPLRLEAMQLEYLLKPGDVRLRLSRCFLKPFFSSTRVAFSIIVGSDFTIWFSA